MTTKPLGVPPPQNDWAAHYEVVMERTFGDLYARLTTCALSEVGARLPHPSSIVDFGAGCGRLAVPLAAAGYRVTAVEPSTSMLDQLRLRAGGLPIELVPSTIQAYRAQAPHDMALCVFTVLSYLLDERSLAEAFAAVAGALRPGGLFLLDVPHRDVFESFEHDTADIIRRVEVDPVSEDSPLFDYREETTVRTPDGQASYVTDFRIRHWEQTTVLASLTASGFAVVDDVSARFDGLGADYLLVRAAT